MVTWLDEKPKKSNYSGGLLILEGLSKSTISWGLWGLWQASHCSRDLQKPDWIPLSTLDDTHRWLEVILRVALLLLRRLTRRLPALGGRRQGPVGVRRIRHHDQALWRSSRRTRLLDLLLALEVHPY